MNKFKKQLVWILLVFAFICGVFLIINEMIIFRDNMPDLNVYIGITSLLVVFWSEKNKIFDQFWVRLCFFTLITVNLFVVVILFFTESLILVNIASFLILSIVVFMTILTLQRLFRNQISSDVFFLKNKVRGRLKSIKKEFNMKELIRVIDNISDWSKKNVNNYKLNNDISTIMSIYEEINNLIINNKYTIQEKLHENDEVLEKLRASYLSFYNVSSKSNLERNFIEHLSKIFKHFYISKNNDFLLFYLSVIYELIEMDFSNSLRSSESVKYGRNITSYFRLLEDIYQNNNPSNSILRKSISVCMIHFKKYSFDISDKVTIMILQEYVNVVLHITKYDYDLTDIDTTAPLVYHLHSECIPRNLRLFYDSRMNSILNITEDISKKFEVMSLVFRIVYDNKYDKSVLFLILNIMSEILEKNDSEDYMETYIELLHRLDYEEIKYHSIQRMFKHFSIIDTSHREVFFDNTVGKLLLKKETLKYFFNELISYTTDQSIENVTSLIQLMVKNIYYKNIIMKEIPFTILYEKSLDILAKKYLYDEEKLHGFIEIILDSIDSFYKSSSDISVCLMCISILEEQLKNVHIRRKIFEFLLKMAYVAIESGEHEVYSKISNSIGWHLYKLIQKREKDSSSDELPTIKYVFKNFISFYKEVFDFRNSDTIFVGTVVVVNLSFAESLILDSIRNENKIYYKDIKEYMISELRSNLSDPQLLQIKKSAQIRKFSIESYIRCNAKFPKQIVNDIFSVIVN
jgi:hypothetical protein